MFLRNIKMLLLFNNITLSVLPYLMSSFSFPFFGRMFGSSRMNIFQVSTWSYKLRAAGISRRVENRNNNTGRVSTKSWP